jgi:DNA-binding response OmpR family regulator
MRRINNFENSEKEFKYKDIFYDVWKNIFFKNSIEINLTWKQKQLVAYFIMNIWQVIKKTRLTEDVWWEYNSNFITNNTINVTICKIRKKLWDEFKLETVHSEGYILKE